MSELLAFLALSWFVPKWFVGTTRVNVTDFLMCEEVTGDGIQVD